MPEDSLNTPLKLYKSNVHRMRYNVDTPGSYSKKASCGGIFVFRAISHMFFDHHLMC